MTKKNEIGLPYIGIPCLACDGKGWLEYNGNPWTDSQSSFCKRCHKSGIESAGYFLTTEQAEIVLEALHRCLLSPLDPNGLEDREKAIAIMKGEDK